MEITLNHAIIPAHNNGNRLSSMSVFSDLNLLNLSKKAYIGSRKLYFRSRQV